MQKFKKFCFGWFLVLLLLGNNLLPQTPTTQPPPKPDTIKISVDRRGKLKDANGKDRPWQIFFLTKYLNGKNFENGKARYRPEEMEIDADLNSRAESIVEKDLKDKNSPLYQQFQAAMMAERQNLLAVKRSGRYKLSNGNLKNPFRAAIEKKSDDVKPPVSNNSEVVDLKAKLAKAESDNKLLAQQLKESRESEDKLRLQLAEARKSNDELSAPGYVATAWTYTKNAFSSVWNWAVTSWIPRGVLIVTLLVIGVYLFLNRQKNKGRQTKTDTQTSYKEGTGLSGLNGGNKGNSSAPAPSPSTTEAPEQVMLTPIEETMPPKLPVDPVEEVVDPERQTTVTPRIPKPTAGKAKSAATKD